MDAYRPGHEMHAGGGRRYAATIYRCQVCCWPATWSSRAAPQTHSEKLVCTAILPGQHDLLAVKLAVLVAARWMAGGREAPLAAHGCAVFTLTSHLA
jgi:hypothetical protein